MQSSTAQGIPPLGTVAEWADILGEAAKNDGNGPMQGSSRETLRKWSLQGWLKPTLVVSGRTKLYSAAAIREALAELEKQELSVIIRMQEAVDAWERTSGEQSEPDEAA